MLWFKREPLQRVDHLEPAELRVSFDAGILESKLERLLDATAERGGIDVFLDALRGKQTLFTEALRTDVLLQMDAQSFQAVLDTVFPARRRLGDVVSSLSMDDWRQRTELLLRGKQSLSERLDNFVSVAAASNKKQQRALWDFAVELVHFNDPEHYPLMTRWIWDAKTQSGSLREFIRANDTMQTVDMGVAPEDFEAARLWIIGQLSEKGFYRDLPLLVDLVKAQAYADYVLAMSSGMGMMGSEFGGRMEPLDFVVKLLGIEPARNGGRSRLKAATVH
ncbi:MAG: hypothetical protein OEW58_06075 [Gammaproteobacteria bacterium]|nr:hypothetical protein [Gammaproteobacteria bacterium]